MVIMPLKSMRTPLPVSACTSQLFLERVLVGGDREIVYGARERLGVFA